MSLIAKLYDEDIGKKRKPVRKYSERFAARAVIIYEGKIAVMNVKKDHYHKIPGGGIDQKESILQGLNREVEEEAGCTVVIKKKLGDIIEYRTHTGLKQTSYCYLAELKSLSKQNLTAEEKAHGFSLEWMSLEKALKLFEKDNPKSYDAKFMVKRDLLFIQEAYKIIALEK